jgi:acyl carrier protein
MMTIPVDEICTLIGLQLGRRRVQAGDHILEELGAESVDVINIVAAIEEKYQIVIDESELAHITTVASLHDLVCGLIAS